MYSAKEIASFFIVKGIEEGNPVTQMKLQKLIYFANGYVLTTTNGERKLTDETFEAWEFGPVLPSIYQEYKLFGANEITPENDFLSFLGGGRKFEISEKLTEEDKKILGDIWNSLKAFSGIQLSTITHSENSAWSKVFKRGVNSIPIKDEDIIAEMKPLIKD